MADYTELLLCRVHAARRAERRRMAEEHERIGVAIQAGLRALDRCGVRERDAGAAGLESATEALREALGTARRLAAELRGTGRPGAPGTATDPAGQDVLTVAVAGGQELLRAGLGELLRADGTLRAVGEAAVGGDALALAARHRPDVLLLDVDPPGPAMFAVLAGLCRDHLGTSVIALSARDDPGLIRQLLDSGAAAFLSKTVTRRDLLAAIHAAGHSEHHVLVSLPRAAIKDQGAQPAGTGLSAREREVLGLLAQARSNAQIGAELFISEGTVKRHLSNIYAKLGAVSRVDAMRKATAGGLIGDPG